MAELLSQTSFPMFTNLPTDVITNTMHWVSDGISKEAATIEIANRLSDFYDTVYSDTASAASYVGWLLGETKVYDLADPLPRLPEIQSVPVSVTGASNSTVPTEVAVVLSYHAAPVSGVPASRLRNRIYLGGLGVGAMSAGGVTSFPTIASSFRTTIASAAAALLAANTADLEWVQRSQAGLIQSRSIVGGWVDNSPDSQRRRSVVATTRTLWS